MDKSKVAPFWVSQYRIFGARLKSLAEECTELDDKVLDALCKNEELPYHLVQRMNFLCGASLDKFGFSYRLKSDLLNDNNAD